MSALLLVPAILSALVLAAHFLRGGQPLLVALALGCIVLLAVPRAWATRAVQAVLLLGTVEWVRTLVSIARVRASLGEPWLRMALILGTVALVSGIAALALELRFARAQRT